MKQVKKGDTIVYDSVSRMNRNADEGCQLYEDLANIHKLHYTRSIHFKNSIQEEGFVNEIIVAPDMTIISGHQRVRAAKELGIETIMVDIRKYDSEDKILKDLIETNIRQRGIGNPNPIKLGRCIKELERIYGIRDGSTNKQGTIVGENFSFTQQNLADEFGIDVRTMQNYKKLTELVPELQDWVDTGILAPTTAIALIKYMSPSEQEDFVKSMDITQKITKREVQQYIDKIKRLESNNPKVKELQNQIFELKADPNAFDRSLCTNLFYERIEVILYLKCRSTS